MDTARPGELKGQIIPHFQPKPRAIALDDESLLLVTCEALGPREAVICFMGQLGESFGLALFQELGGYDALIAAAVAPPARPEDPAAERAGKAKRKAEQSARKKGR